MTEKFTLEQIKKSLEKANGFISVAAKNLNCDKTTVYDYIKKYPELNDTLQEIRNNTLDYAESKLLQHIDNNNFNALKFFLETQGKQRGYTVRTENLNMEVQTFGDIPDLKDLKENE